MDWNLFFSGLTSTALVAGAIVGGYQLRKIEQQEQLHVFTTYTKRYSDIVDNMPSAAYSLTRSMLPAGAKDDPKYDDLMRQIRKFFNLCSEEYYLAAGDKIESNHEGTAKGKKTEKTKKIDTDVWRVWKSGMIYHMKNKTFLAGWDEVAMEGYSKKFKKFIKEEIIPAPLEDELPNSTGSSK
jgi:hypothetical protein